MIANLLNISVLSLFLFCFISIAEYSKDKTFIQQASFHALRSHYLGQNYQTSLDQYSQRTTQKKYDFQSSRMNENKTQAVLYLSTQQKNKSFILNQLNILSKTFKYKAQYLKGKP